MKKYLPFCLFVLVIIAMSAIAAVVQSGWTSTSNPATARTALDVLSKGETTNAIGGVLGTALTNNDTRSITLNGSFLALNGEISLTGGGAMNTLKAGSGDLHLSAEPLGGAKIVIDDGVLTGNGGGLTNTPGLSFTAAGSNIQVSTNNNFNGSKTYTIFTTATAKTSDPLSQFALTTSAQLAGVLTDESGSAGVFPRFSLTSLTAGQGMVWDGTKWTNGVIAGTAGTYVNDTGLPGVVSVDGTAIGTNLSSLATTSQLASSTNDSILSARYISANGGGGTNISITNLTQRVINPVDGSGITGFRFGSGIRWQTLGGADLFGFAPTAFAVYTNLTAAKATFTGITNSALTASRIQMSDANGGESSAAASGSQLVRGDGAAATAGTEYVSPAQLASSTNDTILHARYSSVADTAASTNDTVLHARYSSIADTASATNNSILGARYEAKMASGGVSNGPITSSGLTMATARLLGRTTAGTGVPEAITVGAGLSLGSGTLTATALGTNFWVADTGGGGGYTNLFGARWEDDGSKHLTFADGSVEIVSDAASKLSRSVFFNSAQDYFIVGDSSPLLGSGVPGDAYLHDIFANSYNGAAGTAGTLSLSNAAGTVRAIFADASTGYIKASGGLIASNSSPSKVAVWDGGHSLTNSGLGAVPINGDSTATTYAQILALVPGGVLQTNGQSFAMSFNGNSVTNVKLGSIVSPTNTFGSQAVDFALVEASTNASANISFVQALTNLNPSNTCTFVLHVLANGADRTVTKGPGWRSTRTTHIVTNGSVADFIITAIHGQFTNMSQVDYVP